MEKPRASSSNHSNDYQQAFAGDDESLALFLQSIARFDRQFCDAMASGADFTIRIEVHGNKGRMIHSRVQSDCFERPKEAPRDMTKRRKNYE